MQSRTFLQHWSIKIAPKEQICSALAIPGPYIQVEGFKVDPHSNISALWHSSVIKERLGPTLLQTYSGGIYELIGPHHTPLISSHSHPCTKEVNNLLRQGFPENWKEIVVRYLGEWESRKKEPQLTPKPIQAKSLPENERSPSKKEKSSEQGEEEDEEDEEDEDTESSSSEDDCEQDQSFAMPPETVKPRPTPRAYSLPPSSKMQARSAQPNSFSCVWCSYSVTFPFPSAKQVETARAEHTKVCSRLAPQQIPRPSAFQNQLSAGPFYDFTYQIPFLYLPQYPQLDLKCDQPTTLKRPYPFQQSHLLFQQPYSPYNYPHGAEAFGKLPPSKKQMTSPPGANAANNTPKSEPV